MKKLSLVAAAALMATTAFAGDHSLNLVGRMSWAERINGKTYNDQRIEAEFAKAFFAGKLSGNTNYHLTLDLTNSNSATGTDVTSNFIDEVYVTKTLMEGLTLDLGKRVLLGGGFELTHDTVDQYAQSHYFTTAFQNQFGATLSKEIMGHSLMLQVANGNKDRKPNGNDKSQSRMGWAAEWLGSYGMLKTNVGYTVIPDADRTKSTNLLGLGLQFTLPMAMVLETDYGVVTSKNGLGAGATLTDSKVTSMVGTLSWGMNEHVTPFLKFVQDANKDANIASHYGEKTLTTTTVGLGVELKESKADGIRYHVVYTNSKNAYETIANAVQGTNYTDSKIMIGAKFDAAILK